MVGTRENQIFQFYYLILYGEENELKIKANIRIKSAWKYHTIHRHHAQWGVGLATTIFVAAGTL